MSLLPISSGKVAFDSTAVAAGNAYKDGLRFNASTGAVKGVVGTPVAHSQGLPMSANGQLCVYDATASLPAGTLYSNGFPIKPTGELCVSTGAVVSTSSGIPYVANGAVSVNSL